MIQFQLLHLGCSACAQRIEQLVLNPAEVGAAQVDFAQARLVLECLPSFDMERLHSVLHASYDALPFI